MTKSRKVVAFAAAIISVAMPIHADIYQWEYINPADPGEGKRQSTTLAPDGAGVDAVPGADLGSRDLTMAYLIGADLMGTFGNDASFFNADLSQANLTNANFAHSILTDANFTGAEVRGAYFYTDTYHHGTGITLAQLYSTASYEAHNLSGIKLSGNNLAAGNFWGQNLTNSEFYGTTLTDANFYVTNLTNATFFGASLTEADFTEANLTGGSFYQANAPGANFNEANLTNADFGRANLTGANFREANLANARFVYYQPPQSCNSFICIAAATFTDADLSGADARGASLAFNNSSPFLNLSLSEKITTNLILPDGHIDGLDLNAGMRLVVRDYDGDPTRTNAFFGTPEPVPPIPLTIDQHFTIVPGGTLRMEFEADAWDSTISFAPGIPATLGGSLELTFADDVNVASQVGRTFDLFDWTGIDPVGEFEVNSPYEWDLSNLYITGEVTMLAVPEAPSIVVALGLLGFIARVHRPSPRI